MYCAQCYLTESLDLWSAIAASCVRFEQREDMTTWLFGFGAVALVAVGFRFLRQGDSLTGWTEHAAQTGELRRLIQYIEEQSDPSTKWDQAIGALWNTYHRELAAQLVVEGAQRNDATVFQFWMKRIIEVEPEVASAHFTEAFLLAHFQPELAATCGKGCGCG